MGFRVFNRLRNDNRIIVMKWHKKGPHPHGHGPKNVNNIFYEKFFILKVSNSTPFILASPWQLVRTSAPP